MNQLSELAKKFSHQKQPAPLLFIGHGSPMNAIETNAYTMAWQELGKILPKPKAILIISAHWITEGTYVHTGLHPKTIHDFWGFPEELYSLSYPAPGAPTYTELMGKEIKTPPISPDHEWGLDHGAWVPLLHLFPTHEIPTFQMSIDAGLSLHEHYALGQKLSFLREHGVMIIGSGNIVHNLREISWEKNAGAFPWAKEFDERVSELLLSHNDAKLIAYPELGAAAHLAVPTPDHFWPLLYILGAKERSNQIFLPVEGIAHGSISMRAVLYQ